MLAFYGFATIAVFLIVIMTKRLSVISALVLVPVFFAVLAGFDYGQIGAMAFTGIKQVAPTGILLMFAVLYFSIMLDTGLFDPVILKVIKTVKGDPLKIVVGTAILTMLVHLDGDGTATFMIVLTTFLPIYKKLGMNRLILAGIVALSVGPLHLVPWSGTSVRAMSTLSSNTAEMFSPNVPAMIGGICWVLLVAWIFGSRERKRLGVVKFEYEHATTLNTLQKTLRRPNLIITNAVLTTSLIILLLSGKIPAAALFVIATMIALVINYSKPADQQTILKAHGTNIFLVSSMVFAAGVYSGILQESKMIASMANILVKSIPKEHASYIPVLTAIVSMPASVLFTPDAYYYGVVPIIAQTCSEFGIDPVQTGRASLLGQMTVGFPLSPLTASTFLLIGLAEVELGEHQRFIFKWAWGTTIVMTIIAVLTGSITI